MDRSRFFSYLKNEQSILFENGLSDSQISGLQIKLDVWAKWYAPNHPVTYLAAALGQIYHETGAYMTPVLEAFAPDRQTSVLLLDKAFNEGRLKWVKQPYWLRDESGKHPVGCGDIQITHRKNYVNAENKLREKFGVDVKLSEDYDLALNPIISAHIAFSGMIDGWFRPCKLSDFELNEEINYCAARDIVNGDTGLIGEKINLYCTTFQNAMLYAGAADDFGTPNTPIDWPSS